MTVVACAVALGVAAGSCAYYNTFYLARKYYDRATTGQPYEVDRANSSQAANYQKALDYSKKLIASYPKSKWVDDAYLMWARCLIGRDDPLQTVNMLQDFPSNFPKSDLKAEAEFYLGLAYRQARRYPQAISSFDEFLAQAPKNALAPYAYYERSLAQMSLKHYAEAGDDAGEILKRFPKSTLYDRALRQRAEARLQQGVYDEARADFHQIGLRAENDEERFQFFMREVDCLESARRYDDELATLRDELSHTPPPPPPVPGQLPPVGADHYGRIVMRMGTALLLAGKPAEALDRFSGVVQDYPKTALAAEAQYRIGFAYETGLDDFTRALEEYGKVKEQFGTSGFTQLAQQRADNLQRIEQFRTGTGADSLAKKAEAAFLTAELYLFQLDKPDRALEEYRKVATDYAGTAVAGRAINAQAWVLSRKLDRKGAADSLFWQVVHRYPATEAQVAARDYLEMDGQHVPDSLIVLPAPPAPDTTRADTALAQPPATVPAIGAGAFGRADSIRMGLLGPGGRRNPVGLFPGPDSMHVMTPRDSMVRAFQLRADSLRRISIARSDSMARAAAAIRDSVARAAATRDSLARAAAADSLTRAAGAASPDSLAKPAVPALPDSLPPPAVSPPDSTKKGSGR